jgi:hypothetical protein
MQLPSCLYRGARFGFVAIQIADNHAPPVICQSSDNSLAKSLRATSYDNAFIFYSSHSVPFSMCDIADTKSSARKEQRVHGPSVADTFYSLARTLGAQKSSRIKTTQWRTSGYQKTIRQISARSLFLERVFNVSDQEKGNYFLGS